MKMIVDQLNSKYTKIAVNWAKQFLVIFYQKECLLKV